jgi:cold shock CspA family protein
MKGRISRYFADRGFGFLVVKGREEDVYFRADHLQETQQPLITEGLWAEFELGPSPRGNDMAINIRLLLDEDVSVDDWACILVDEAGNWSSTTANEDRAIVLAFLPSADTLSELIRQHGPLLERFHASETGSARANQFRRMGEIVQDLTKKQKAAFAVGRIPAVRWPRVESMGASLWAAMIARLVAIHLPFVRGRVWVAIEDLSVNPALWNFYRHELRGRFADACYMLNRPDRAQVDAWLRLCIYAKR